MPGIACRRAYASSASAACRAFSPIRDTDRRSFCPWELPSQAGKALGAWMLSLGVAAVHAVIVGCGLT